MSACGSCGRSDCNACSNCVFLGLPDVDAIVTLVEDTIISDGRGNLLITGDSFEEVVESGALSSGSLQVIDLDLPTVVSADPQFSWNAVGSQVDLDILGGMTINPGNLPADAFTNATPPQPVSQVSGVILTDTGADVTYGPVTWALNGVVLQGLIGSTPLPAPVSDVTFKFQATYNGQEIATPAPSISDQEGDDDIEPLVKSMTVTVTLTTARLLNISFTNTVVTDSSSVPTLFNDYSPYRGFTIAYANGLINIPSNLNFKYTSAPILI